MDNSFHIFIIPPDAEWFATQLPNKNWAVWNDEGQPPFEYKEFVKWAEAIRYLRDIFEKNGYPEENWNQKVLNKMTTVILKDLIKQTYRGLKRHLVMLS